MCVCVCFYILLELSSMLYTLIVIYNMVSRLYYLIGLYYLEYLNCSLWWTL